MQTVNEETQESLLATTVVGRDGPAHGIIIHFPLNPFVDGLLKPDLPGILLDEGSDI